MSDSAATGRDAVWGVLVAQQCATVENGLLAYLEHRQRPPASSTKCGDDHDAAAPTHSADYMRLSQALAGKVSASALARYLPQAAAVVNADGATPLLAPEAVVVPLWHDVTSVGRLASNDIPLSTNPCISGVHCSLSLIATTTSTTTDGESASQEASGHARQAVSDLVSHLVGDAAATTAQPPSTSNAHVPSSTAARDDAPPATTERGRRVRVSDYSTNSCLVNGSKIGKGHAYSPLASGDVVDIMNAGPRHTAEYNLSFVYYHLDDFTARAAGEVQGDSTKASHSTATTTAATVTANGDRQARRRALLARAQWNILAQVYRMYHHDVEDFYLLDKDVPLGVGGFGKVYRGALRSGMADTGAAPSLSQSRTALARRIKELAPAPAHYMAKGEKGDQKTGPGEQDEELRKSTYVQLKAQEAPASVLAAVAHHKRPRSSCNDNGAIAEDASALPPPFVFAVKVVNKQRMLLQALGDDGTAPAPGGGPPPAAPIALNENDRQALRQLLQLETQQEDYAAQRERDLLDEAITDVFQQHGVMSQASGEDTHAHKSSFLLGSPSQAGAVDGLPAEWPMPASTQAQEAQARAAAARTQRREELLGKLSPQLRRFYQKELQQKRRQQCEISILLAVNHPSVARLYEVFDRPTRLSLVMEQATGGEVWDLLQPPAVKDTGAGKPSAHDEEGLSAGGPLPEFVVKMLMVQVLEAVHYLHSMGIIHRDLKLENLLLQQPCRVAGLSSLQLNVMRQRLQDARHWRSQQQAVGTTTTTAQPASTTASTARVAIANPLSLLHTVHVPRPLWPVVKVTDFGLSFVMGGSGGGTGISVHSRRRHGKGQTDPAAAGEDDDTALVYARNDMTTSCGTPIYAAPEVVNPQLRPDRVGYSAAVDMYSVGVIAFALLTGHAPFPSRQRGGGGTVVDYTAPLSFERCRKVRHPRKPSADGASAVPLPPPAQCVALPPLTCVEEVNVSASDLAAHAEEQGHARASRWETDLKALERRIAAAEQRRTQQPHAATEGHVFDGLLADTIKALGDYGDARAQASQDLDLDRLVWHSMQRHAQRQTDSHAATAAITRPHDTQYPLPPVSLMGQDFIRSLLLARPTDRLTARQALQHPWLRDCVAPECVQ